MKKNILLACFSFLVSRKAARDRGWELPAAVMVLADEVVER